MSSLKRNTEFKLNKLTKNRRSGIETYLFISPKQCAWTDRTSCEYNKTASVSEWFPTWHEDLDRDSYASFFRRESVFGILSSLPFRWTPNGLTKVHGTINIITSRERMGIIIPVDEKKGTERTGRKGDAEEGGGPVPSSPGLVHQEAPRLRGHLKFSRPPTAMGITLEIDVARPRNLTWAARFFSPALPPFRHSKTPGEHIYYGCLWPGRVVCWLRIRKQDIPPGFIWSLARTLPAISSQVHIDRSGLCCGSESSLQQLLYIDASTAGALWTVARAYYTPYASRCSFSVTVRCSSRYAFIPVIRSVTSELYVLLEDIHCGRHDMYTYRSNPSYYFMYYHSSEENFVKTCNATPFSQEENTTRPTRPSSCTPVWTKCTKRNSFDTSLHND